MSVNATGVTKSRVSISELSSQALVGALSDSPTLQSTQAAVKKLDSQSFRGLLSSLVEAEEEQLLPQLRQIHEDLEDWVRKYTPAGDSDIQHSDDTETTPARQQLQTNKARHKPLAARGTTEYATLVERFLAVSESLLAEALVRPQDMPLHEVFLFDFKSPLKDAFAPRPRFTLERALSAPFDYLVSDADDAPAAARSADQPAVALLYQLYLESGALVNVYDLWHAFHATFEAAAQGDGCDENLTMALFYQALAELKMFGLVKNSRKKADHIAKSGWQGL